MAKLCTCSAKFSLPSKRNLILTTEDPRANQYHSKEFCVEVWHGRNEHGPRQAGNTLLTPVNFHLLGKEPS